jgi:hypothetical protein
MVAFVPFGGEYSADWHNVVHSYVFQCDHHADGTSGNAFAAG